GPRGGGRRRVLAAYGSHDDFNCSLEPTPRLARTIPAAQTFRSAILGRKPLICETDDQKRMIQRWLKLAIQLNGAIDTGQYDEVRSEERRVGKRTGTLFGGLAKKLTAEVWTISKLTDVDRHTLLKMWRHLAEPFTPYQFH